MSTATAYPPIAEARAYLAKAEETCWEIPGMPKEYPLPAIKKVGVLGAGTMGGGIAMNFLNVGWPVTLFEVNPTALDRGIQTIRKNYENTAKKGRLTSADVEKRMSLLRGSTDFSSLADCDLIVEAIYENMEVKKDVFRKLGAVAKKDAILGTNTSALDIDEIASVLPEERRQYVVGHHYFSPANVMKMIEVVQARSTSLPVLAASMAISRHIGKTAVVAGVCYGFIGNRILFQRQREANRLVVEDGLMPWVVDRVLLQFGFPMGPFQMGDLAGLDVGWDPKKSAGRTIGERLCEMDRRGQKTGKGWYDYTDTRQAVPSKEVEEVIRKFRAEKGYGASKERSENEILERLLVPMINEAAEILEQGKAFRASDIDVMYVNGYGFPSAKGGLLFFADHIGLPRILTKLRALEAEHGAIFKPCGLLERMVRDGIKFSDLPVNEKINQNKVSTRVGALHL